MWIAGTAIMHAMVKARNGLAMKRFLADLLRLEITHYNLSAEMFARTDIWLSVRFVSYPFHLFLPSHAISS
jgi:hypothetical protein